MNSVWSSLIVNVNDVSEDERVKLIDVVYELCDRLFLSLSEFGRAVSVPEQFYVEGGVPAHVQIPLKYVENAVSGVNPLRISANPRVDPVMCGGLTCVPYVESVVFDVDSDDMWKSIEAACRFARWLEREFGIVSQVLYTGRNACLRVFIRGRLGTETYERLWQNLAGLFLLHAEHIGIPRTVTVDPRSSSVAIHVRVPYTANEKSRTYVRVIDYSGKPLDLKDIDVPWNSQSLIKPLLDIKLSIDVKQLIAQRQKALDVAKHGKAIQQQKTEAKPRVVSRQLPRTLLDIDLELHPPCIRAIIEELYNGGYPSHNARFALASYMLRLCVEVLGRKIDECIQEVETFFKHAGDYRPEKTRYQLSHIGGLVGRKTFYMTPNCETMKEWGLCPFGSSEACGIKNPLTYIVKRLRRLAKTNTRLRIKVKIPDVDTDDYGGIM